MLVGMAPAVELEVVAVVVLADEVAEPVAAVPVPELEAAEVVVAVEAPAVLVPQLSRMLLVQLLWPVESPTLALMHSSAASSQIYCGRG